MNFNLNQRVVAYTVIGVLAVALVVVLVYSQLIGRTEPVASTSVSVSGLNPSEASKSFDVSVLSSEGYTVLDKSSLDSNKLPVQPPTERGKTNLFGI